MSGSHLVAKPFIPISRGMSSHNAAQGVIYADQMKRAGMDITVNMSLDLYESDFNKFDRLACYHGNDFDGHLNLFGGLSEFPHVDNFVNFCRFKGPVTSLVIDFPRYSEMLEHKVTLANDKKKSIDPRWNLVEWENLRRMEREAVTVDPNLLIVHDRVATGDSHATSMYRPGWTINPVPYKTLHGALSMGLEKFVRFAPALEKKKLRDVEVYFGNIDIRHHLMRRDDPRAAASELAAEYVSQARELARDVSGTVTIWELLPIENSRRAIPKTGWYEGTPYYGSWAERTDIRDFLNAEIKKRVRGKVRFFEWTEKLRNGLGELSFSCMEQPKSVHLSRAFYPHWTGAEWNRSKTENSLEFLTEIA
jgi:hypothetical protein